MTVLTAQTSEEHLLKWKGETDRRRKQHPPARGVTMREAERTSVLQRRAIQQRWGRLVTQEQGEVLKLIF